MSATPPLACDRGPKPDAVLSGTMERTRRAEREAKRNADLDRAAARLATHTVETCFSMTDTKTTPATLASMLSNMAEVHRRAAERVEAAALKARLSMKARTSS